MPAMMSCFPSGQVRLSRQPEAVTGQFTNAAIVRLRSRARQNGRLLQRFFIASWVWSTIGGFFQCRYEITNAFAFDARRSPGRPGRRFLLHFAEHLSQLCRHLSQTFRFTFCSVSRFTNVVIQIVEFERVQPGGLDKALVSGADVCIWFNSPTSQGGEDFP